VSNLSNVKINLEEVDAKRIKRLEKLLYSGNTGEKRNYQRRILLKSAILAEDGSDSILIQSPTGSGKTFIGLTLANFLQKQSGLYGKSPKVAWVSMRANLRTQAERDRLKFSIDADIDYISQLDKNPGQYDIVIFDEAHHAPCASGQNIVHKTKAKMVIGLSATPMRQDKASLLFRHYLVDANVRELVREGYLSKFDIGIIPDYEVSTIAQAYLSKREEFGKTVFFMKSYDEMIELAEILNKNKVRYEIVTSKNGSSDAEKERQLKAFKEGEVTVLINQLILTEGFDDDTLKTVFVRDSLKSCVTQMAGRALRRNDRVGRKYIIQSLNTKSLFSNTAKPEENLGFLNGEWVKKASLKNLIDIITKSITIRVNSTLNKIKNEESEASKQESLKEYKKVKDMINAKKKNKEALSEFRNKHDLYSNYGIVPHYIRVTINEVEYLISFKFNRIHTVGGITSGLTTVVVKQKLLEMGKESIIKEYKTQAKSLEELKGIQKIKGRKAIAASKSEHNNPFMAAFEESAHLNAATINLKNLNN